MRHLGHSGGATERDHMTILNVPNLLAFAAIVMLCLALGLWHEHGDEVSTEFLGTWTEETGQPGNSIKFFLVRASMPANYVGLVPYEGRVTFIKHFGQGEIQATCNYSSFDP